MSLTELSAPANAGKIIKRNAREKEIIYQNHLRRPI